MKTFFLHIDKSQCTVDGDTWTTPSIDLYFNEWYINYSVTKSGYGLNLLGDNTWTGLEQVSPTESEAGFIDGGMWVDTTGRIDVVSHFFAPSGGSLSSPSYKLDYYATDDDSAEPTFALEIGAVEIGQDIDVVNSPRYGYFTFTFDNPMGYPIDGTFVIRVEIDRPVMAPFYSRTRALLDRYPEWMSLRELDNVSATPTLDQPETLTGKFLNAVSGEWLEELGNDLTYLNLQRYITTVDLNQIAWVYRLEDIGDFIYRVEGDDSLLAQAGSLEEFYDTTDNQDVYYWDEENDTVFVRKSYGSVVVGIIIATEGNFPLITDDGIDPVTEETYTSLNSHQIWNWVDDIGLLVDLYRLHLEDNETFQKRILDVYQNKPGVGVDNFKKALRRELNIWRVYGATPDSAYLGATPEVLEVWDIEQDPLFITPEGLPTDRFVRLVGKLAKDYPSTWGNFFYDQAYWDLGGAKHEGYTTLPSRFDATPLLAADTQPGVGDLNDLYVYRPDVVPGPNQFDAYIKLRGKQRGSRTEYTKVTLDVQVNGRAPKTIYTNPTNTIWLTARIEDASGYWYYPFQVSVTNDASNANPTGTSNSHVHVDMFDADGYSRWAFKDADGMVYYDEATPAIPFLSDLQSMALLHGRYDFDTDTLVDQETSDTFAAWFSNDESTLLEYNTPSDIIAALNFLTEEPHIVVASRETSTSAGYWTSEDYFYTIELNGVAPDQTVQDYELALPPISWDPFLGATPTMEYVIKIITRSMEATPQYGAYALDDNDNNLFLHDGYIYLDGSNGWTNGEQIVSDSTSSVTFSTGASGDPTPIYPITGSSWTLFEATAGPYQGIVDENGPWRNDLPARDGNFSYNWRYLELDRSDFGIPNSDDYIPTWIGIESSNPNVIVWLGSNTVVPINEPADLTYPANAVEEYYDAGTYGFESFVAKARLRPDPIPEWNPLVNSGTFYEDADEYYMYAERREAVVTGSSVVLDGVAHQGAPIIVYTDEDSPTYLRRMYYEDSATPVTGVTETVAGTGTETLYLSYPDIYNVVVTNDATGLDVTVDTSSSNQTVLIGEYSDPDSTYTVSYDVRNSFYVQMNYTTGDGEYNSRVVFDQPGSYVVNYEGSIFNPATPIDLPLSPLFTTIDEGFIFISHEEYAPHSVVVYVSPSHIKADGRDYLQITLRSLDDHGNPKSNQTFTLSSDFGTLNDTSITTDRDGFGATLLIADASPPVGTLTGTLTISGYVNTTVEFDIEAEMEDIGELVAIPSAEEIPADGVAKINVFGRVEDANHDPRASTVVKYRRGRSLYELFQNGFEGEVVTNADGEFVIGPFTAATPSDAGYWFLSAETDPAFPDTWVGDVVFWNEYPTAAYGFDDLTGLPHQAIQMATPVSAIPPYAYTYKYPVTYDEADGPTAATPTVNWEPPRWFAIRWNTQYQLGIISSEPGQLDPDYTDKAHPPRRDW